MFTKVKKRMLNTTVPKIAINHRSGKVLFMENHIWRYIKPTNVNVKEIVIRPKITAITFLYAIRAL